VRRYIVKRGIIKRDIERRYIVKRGPHLKR